MSVGDYLIVSGSLKDTAGGELSLELAHLARKAGFEVTELNPAAWLAVTGPHRPGTLTVGGWTLVGDVFNRRNATLPSNSASDPDDYERKLMARFWGRYIGVRFDPINRIASVLRDPSGAQECIAWTHRDLTFVASDAPEWLVRRLRPPWRVNPARVSQALRNPFLSSGPLLFDGPKAIDPGTVQPLPLETPARPVWRPADIATRSLVEPPTLEEAADGLRSAIDEAVLALAGVSGPVAAEVSGGLDSSIIASCLVGPKSPGVAIWLNAYGSTPEAENDPGSTPWRSG